jgi:hypothetical protein
MNKELTHMIIEAKAEICSWEAGEPGELLVYSGSRGLKIKRAMM